MAIRFQLEKTFAAASPYWQDAWRAALAVVLEPRGLIIDAEDMLQLENGGRLPRLQAAAFMQRLERGPDLLVHLAGPQFELPSGYNLAELNGSALLVARGGSGRQADVFLDLARNGGRGHASRVDLYTELASLLLSPVLDHPPPTPDDDRKALALHCRFENTVLRAGLFRPRIAEQERLPEQEGTDFFCMPYYYARLPDKFRGEGEPDEPPPAGEGDSDLPPGTIEIGDGGGTGDDDGDEPMTWEWDGDDPRDVPGPWYIGEELTHPELPLCFIIPGVLASRLEDDEGNLLWSNENQSFSITGPSLKDMLPGEPVQPVYVGDGLAATGRPLGGHYEGLITSLESQGYKLGRNLWIFTYDWRQTNASSGNLFAAFVQEKIRQFREKWPHMEIQGVNVIAHSMGGFVARAASQIAPQFQKLVFLGSPHWGAPETYLFLHPQATVNLNGHSLFAATLGLVGVGAAAGDFLRWLLGGEVNNSGYRHWLRYFLAQCPSTFELLPDKTYIDEKQNPVLYLRSAAGGGAVMVEGMDTASKTYFGWTGSVHQLPQQVHLKVVLGLIFKEAIKTYVPGIDYMNLYATTKLTSTGLELEVDGARLTYRSQTGPRAGDATVTSVSAATPRPAAAATWVRGELIADHPFLANDPIGHTYIADFFGL